MTSTAFISVYAAFVSVISHDGFDVDCDSNCDLVNDIVQSNNNDMNPNNDDNVNINANCYYNDTNNILSFYLLWEQVQVRVLDDDHNNNHVDCYDIGIARDIDLVANDR